MSGLEVHIRGDARVVVAGELDLATAPRLTDALQSVADTGAQRVVIDLGGVSFMDSSGLGALHALQRQQAARGGAVVIASISECAAAVLSERLACSCDTARSRHGPPRLSEAGRAGPTGSRRTVVSAVVVAIAMEERDLGIVEGLVASEPDELAPATAGAPQLEAA